MARQRSEVLNSQAIERVEIRSEHVGALEPPARVELARVPYERTRHPMVGGGWRKRGDSNAIPLSGTHRLAPGLTPTCDYVSREAAGGVEPLSRRTPGFQDRRRTTAAS